MACPTAEATGGIGLEHLFVSSAQIRIAALPAPRDASWSLGHGDSGVAPAPPSRDDNVRPNVTASWTARRVTKKRFPRRGVRRKSPEILRDCETWATCRLKLLRGHAGRTQADRLASSRAAFAPGREWTGAEPTALATGATCTIAGVPSACQRSGLARCRRIRMRRALACANGVFAAPFDCSLERFNTEGSKPDTLASTVEPAAGADGFGRPGRRPPLTERSVNARPKASSPKASYPSEFQARPVRRIRRQRYGATVRCLEGGYPAQPHLNPRGACR
jgi:hypothetical protein